MTEYDVEIPVCSQLIMFDIAGQCRHKCNRGRYTICTDFVNNDYQSLLDDYKYKDGYFKGSVAQMLDDYEMKCVSIP